MAPGQPQDPPKDSIQAHQGKVDEQLCLCFQVTHYTEPVDRDLLCSDTVMVELHVIRGKVVYSNGHVCSIMT